MRKAADKKAKDDAKAGITDPDGPSLLPASETGVIEDAPLATDED